MGKASGNEIPAFLQARAVTSAHCYGFASQNQNITLYSSPPYSSNLNGGQPSTL